jgi:hypothetical protein
VVPGAPVTECANADWSAIAIWEDRPLLVEVTDGSVQYGLQQIGLDEDWTIGVRAFDEADNWSPVAEGLLSTRLSRVTIGNLPSFGVSPTDLVSLGDVNDDGRDDLLMTAGFGSGAGLLMLGESDPTAPTIPQNPLLIPSPDAAAPFFGSGVSPVGDVNADGVNDFLIASPVFSAFGGNNTIYLFFGGVTDTFDDRANFVAPDVRIVDFTGRSFEFTFSRSGFGNVVEFSDTSDGTDYDDFFVTGSDYLITEASDVFVISGRSTADWLAATPISITGNPPTDCFAGILTISGTAAPLAGLSTGRFGMSGGVAQLDHDASGFSDLVRRPGTPGAARRRPSTSTSAANSSRVRRRAGRSRRVTSTS